MIDGKATSDIFNANLMLWKSWAFDNDSIIWVDKTGAKHVAKTVSEIKQWFESHSERH